MLCRAPVRVAVSKQNEVTRARKGALSDGVSTIVRRTVRCWRGGESTTKRDKGGWVFLVMYVYVGNSLRFEKRSPVKNSVAQCRYHHSIVLIGH